MKRIVLLIVVVFFVSTGLVQASELYEKLGKMGYTKTQIARVIRTSASRAEAETKMQQMIAEGLVVKSEPKQPQKPPKEQPIVIAETLPEPAQPTATSQVETAVIATTTETVPIQAEQIIVASMDDAATLLAPTDQILSEQKEEAAKTEQSVKQIEYKKKARSQKLVDAGVTTSAIVTAFIPGVGPFIASGIILARVFYGLSQDDE
ncbi:hypothetical protein KJ866_02445 [Patescibacteria group bacterium]|nr:hypothetical protein [Patescibacteria group bacterium]